MKNLFKLTWVITLVVAVDAYSDRPQWSHHPSIYDICGITVRHILTERKSET